jgi:hypothetical protein
MTAMTIRWNVKARAEGKGWANAHQFSVGAGLSYPLAARILEGDPLERIDVATLEKLARVFGLKTPWPLLDYDPKE